MQMGNKDDGMSRFSNYTLSSSNHLFDKFFFLLFITMHFAFNKAVTTKENVLLVNRKDFILGIEEDHMKKSDRSKFSICGV